MAFIKTLARARGKAAVIDRERAVDVAMEVALAVIIFALAANVYANFRFDGPLYRDLAIYMYGGQRVAEGGLPYLDVFDHKGPIPHLLAGLGVGIGRLVGWGDVLGARAVFFVFGCLSAVAVYLLGRGTFSSRSAGILSAVTFLGYYAYARPVASGPEPKTPLVLFQALSLFLMGQKRWFWAALSGSLAFLVWQPMGLLPATCVLLALLSPRAERVNAAVRALAGAAIPPLLTLAWYAYHGALGALAQGFLLFNLLRVDRDGNWVGRIFYPGMPGAQWRWKEVVEGYDLSLVLIFLGLAMVACLVFARPFRYAYLPLLITLPVFVFWTAYDFQAREDFYIFLPYAAAGFGGLIVLGLRGIGASRLAAGLPAFILLLVAFVNTPQLGLGPELGRGDRPGFRLEDQRASVVELRERFGEEPRVVSINAPQALVLLGQENPNPYLFTTDRADRQIAAQFPGGFEGWVESLKEYDPEAVAFYADGQRQHPEDGMSGAHVNELFGWLHSEYEREKIGNFWYYVKRPADQAPAAEGEESTAAGQPSDRGAPASAETG